jgi:hypothetical protein
MTDLCAPQANWWSPRSHSPPAWASPALTRGVSRNPGREGPPHTRTQQQPVDLTNLVVPHPRSRASAESRILILTTVRVGRRCGARAGEVRRCRGRHDVLDDDGGAGQRSGSLQAASPVTSAVATPTW